MTIYVDGEIKNTTTRQAHAVPFTVDEFIIGVYKSGETRAELYIDGQVAEFMMFNDQIDDSFTQVQHYLAKKWGLTDTIDSDGDGVLDSNDNEPLDSSISFDAPDFSDTIDAEIGMASGLDAVEDALAMWLDSKNINGVNNAGIANLSAIPLWADMSGNKYDAEQSVGNHQPILTSEGVQFADSDFMVMKQFAKDFTEGEIFFVMKSPDQPSAHQGGFHLWGASSQHYSGSGTQMVETFGINSTVSQSIGGTAPCSGNRFCWTADNINSGETNTHY